MTELKSRAINYEKMFIEYQNTNISTNKLQLDNLKLIQGMMKDFYEEEINNSKLINNQLYKMRLPPNERHHVQNQMALQILEYNI